MAFSLDFSGKTLNDIEKENGTLPEGLYLARVVATREENSGNAVRQAFDFEVAAGTFAGRKVSDSLMDPNFATTPEKARTVANRCKLFAIRLGAVTRDAEGKAGVQPNWPATVGRTVIIEVNHRPWVSAEKGTKGIAIGLSFAGVFSVDDPSITAEKRSKFGLPPLGATVPVTANSPAAQPAATAAANALFGK